MPDAAVARLSEGIAETGPDVVLDDERQDVTASAIVVGTASRYDPSSVRARS